MFHFHMTAHCLGCGREVPLPKPGSAERVVASTDDEADLFMDVPTKCPQCGKGRVRVRMAFDLAVDVNAGDS